MNTALVALELRKNALAAASVAAAFLITLPIAFLVAATTGMQSAVALEAILTGWLVLGLPLAAVLVGASTGAQSAERESYDAEALFPASTRRRVAASLAAAVILSAAIAGVVLATSLLCGPVLRVLQPGQHQSWNGFWDRVPLAPYLAFLMLDAIAASWALSSLLGHGVGGGLLGLLLSASTLSALLAGFGMEFLYGSLGPSRGWDVSFSRWILPLMAFSVASKVIAAARVASWRERRPRLGVSGAAVLIGGLLAGSAASWALVGRTMVSLRGQMILAGASSFIAYSSSDGQSNPENRAAAGREAAIMTFRGGLILAGAGGARAAIPSGQVGLFDILFHPISTGGLFWKFQRDEHGRLWAQRTTDEVSELWREEPDGTMTFRRDPRSLHSYLMKIERKVVVEAWDASGKKSSFFDVDEFFRRGQLAARMSIDEALSRSRSEAKAADIGCGGRCLRYGGRTWRLPGQALSSYPVSPDWAGGRPVYMIPLLFRGSGAAALCRENGRVDFAWYLRRTPDGWDTVFEALPDGTLFNYGPEDTIGFVDTSGNGVPFASFARLRRDHPDFKGLPTLVRRNADGIDLYWEGRLFSLERNGVVRAVRSLPEGSAYPLRDGFLIVARSRVYFTNWDGATRELRLP